MLFDLNLDSFFASKLKSLLLTLAQQRIRFYQTCLDQRIGTRNTLAKQYADTCSLPFQIQPTKSKIEYQQITYNTNLHTLGYFFRWSQARSHTWHWVLPKCVRVTQTLFEPSTILHPHTEYNCLKCSCKMFFTPGKENNDYIFVLFREVI